MTHPRPPALPSSLAPRGLTLDQAAEYCGVGTSTFNALVAKGDMPAPIAWGRRRVWDRAAIDKRLDAVSRLDRASPAGAKADWLKEFEKGGDGAPA